MEPYAEPRLRAGGWCDLDNLDAFVFGGCSLPTTSSRRSRSGRRSHEEGIDSSSPPVGRRRGRSRLEARRKRAPGSEDTGRPAPERKAGAGSGSPLLVMEGITKRFPGVVVPAMRLSTSSGEVHVVFGENGAGKSTLINVIAGTYPPDEGTMVFEGEEISQLSPHDARQPASTRSSRTSASSRSSPSRKTLSGTRAGPDRLHRPVGAFVRGHRRRSMSSSFFSIKSRVDRPRGQGSSSSRSRRRSWATRRCSSWTS